MIISEEILRIINLNEPRVNVDNIDFDYKEQNNYISITIFFTILNSLEIQTVDISLSRIR